MTLIAQVTATIAAVIILGAYWLLSRGTLSASRPAYHWCIVVASLFMGFSSIVIFNVGSLIINGSFVILALLALRRIRKAKPNAEIRSG